MIARFTTSLFAIITITLGAFGCTDGANFLPGSAGIDQTIDDEDVTLASGNDGALTAVGNPFPKYVGVMEEAPGSGRFRAEINLRPEGQLPAGSVMFSVRSEGTIAGWSLDIGDSPTNNGYAGDSASNSNDAELQILNNSLSIYASDYGDSQLVASESNVIPSNLPSTIRFRISNNKVEYWKNGDVMSKKTITNPNLFALDGRNDAEGPVDYKLYLGVNRVVSNSARTGTGITKVDIYLEDFDFRDTRWLLSKATLPNGTTFIPQFSGQYMMEFERTGTFFGDDNCNSMYGNYKASGNSMTLSKILETKVGCTAGLESFLTYLDMVTSYSATDRQLQLKFTNVSNPRVPTGSGVFYFNKG